MAKSFVFQIQSGGKDTWVEVTPGKSITLTEVCVDKDVGIRMLTERTFNVGDQAEYDSYNLSYYGPIKSITKKNVIIKEKHGDRTRRLPFTTFHWRNINFDLNKKKISNSETIRYI